MSKVLRSFRMSFPVLKHLAINPNKTPYAVEKELNLDRPTVLASLKLLEKAGLIAVAGKPVPLPTGLIRKEYKATPQGVVALLQAHPTYIQISCTDVQVMAQNHAQFLPMVLGKWEHFRQKHVEDQAYRFLLLTAEHTENEVDRLSAVARGESLKSSFGALEAMHRHDIYEGMLVRSAMFGTDEAEKWAEVIRQDRNLRSTAEMEISRLRGEAQESVEYWDGALDDLHGRKHGVISLVAGNPEQAEIWDAFEEFWRYERAAALDEGKPLPSPEELTGQAIEEFLEKLGIRVRKRAKQRSRRESQVKMHARTRNKAVHITRRHMTSLASMSKR